jgi:hypothetical protein
MTDKADHPEPAYRPGWKQFLWNHNKDFETSPDRLEAAFAAGHESASQAQSEADGDQFQDSLRKAIGKRIAEWHLFDGSPAINASRGELEDDILNDVEWLIEHRSAVSRRPDNNAG